tara:strand:- start:1338 stop:1496 length:159 start_codon:yes stop_codon:yes gene_type:complete
MYRDLTGHHLPSIAGSIICQAFVPTPLLPKAQLFLYLALRLLRLDTEPATKE